MAVHSRLKKAFRTLFGPRFTFSEAVLKYLQPSGIKSAFREQVKFNHPDIARNEEEKVLYSQKFQILYDAYRTLLDYKISQSSAASKTIQVLSEGKGPYRGYCDA